MFKGSELQEPCPHIGIAQDGKTIFVKVATEKFGIETLYSER